MPHRYRHSGLRIASALELPEWRTFACEDGGTPDVAIELGEEAHFELGPERMEAEGDRLRFAIEDIGRWEIEGGERIVLHPHAAAVPEQLRLFTLGSAWGALGYQRGLAMWHGSAVARGGRAVLFCGDAGQGKSTMAAALLARGGTLVADDLSRVDPGDSTALIHPSSARIKLWRAAIEHLGWRDRVIERDWFREDKFHCTVPEHAAGCPPLPLAAVVVLEEGETIALTQLAGGEALAALLAGTIYRPEMIEAMGKWGEQAALAARIAGRTPVYRLTRPKDFAALDEAGDAVAGLWEKTA